MKTPASLLLLFILLLVCTDGRASFFKEISTRNGLSNRKVYAAVKDSKGYIWFATHSGIDRYNGENFTHYTLPPFNKETAERARGIIAHPAGPIYAFSDKCLYAYNEQSDAFAIVEETAFTPTEGIIKLCFDRKGTLWIGTSEHLYKQEPNGQIDRLELPRKCAVYDIVSEDQILWIATSKGVLKLIEKSPGTYLTQKEPELKQLDSQRIQSLYYDSVTHQLWIGTFAVGIKCYNTERREMKEVSTQSLNFPIRKIVRINDTKIWAGIDGDGIHVFNRFTSEPEQTYSQFSPQQANLKSNGIYDILNDGTFVWVCTYTAGVFVYNKENISSNRFKQIQNTSHSLGNNHVNAILEDSRKNLWFGTDKGVSLYNTTNKSWKHYLQDHSVVLSIYEDSRNNIWVGGYASDLIRISATSGAAETIHIPHRNRSKNYIYSIVEDCEGDIWLGGVIDDLTRYTPGNQSFRQYKIKGVNKIIEYNRDSLLIATIRGLFFLERESGRIHHVDLLTLGGDRPTHSFPFVNSICIDPANPKAVWIGTEADGMYHYNVEQKRLKRYSTKDGLSSNNVCGIQPDERGRLWIGTESGLNCFNPNPLQIDVFYEIDGLPSDAFNFLAYTTCRNGNMIWGTPEGAFEIVPGAFDKKKEKPLNLRFEGFALFYNRMDANMPDSPLQHPIDSTEVVKLSHQQHSFTFDFINLSYFNNSKLLYSWQLEGFDNQWSVPSSDHKAVYTNIPPGNYTFRVKVFRADNEQETAMRQIKIHIAPPFWATPLAILVYLICMGIVLYFALKAYKDRLEAKDSDQKIRFFVNIAHDIRTPLTLIKAPLNEIESEALSENGLSALQLAKKNTEKLLNMVTQLLDFQKIEREAMNLHIEETEIYSFIDSCVNNFQLLAREKRLNLQLQLPDENTPIKGWIDRKKVTLMIDNLLSNAIKYTRAHGNICVKLTINEERMRLEMIDDGIGISPAAQKKLFRRFYRADNAANSTETGSGIGLLLTRKMVHLHKGSITFSSLENVGTTFTIELPIGKAAYSTSELIRKEHLEPKSGSTETEESEDSNAIKLLLVEDNEELRTYLARYLRKSYQVEEAADGQEALEKVKRMMPDFILSDIVMPNLSGTELCLKLKANIETCHIPVILLTSLAEREDIIKGFNAGADDYITKPFDLSVLGSKINAILRNRTLYRKKYIDKSAFADESTIANELDKQFMRQTVEYIEEKMVSEEFSIDSLAMEMAMSRSVFYKKIKSLTGQNPQEFIRDLKMKKAANLLRDKKYSINEVAYLTGYPNAKYFSTAFKKYYATTPTGFMEQEEAGLQNENPV